MIIIGRQSEIVNKRCNEIGIKEVYRGGAMIMPAVIVKKLQTDIKILNDK